MWGKITALPGKITGVVKKPGMVPAKIFGVVIF
jgi:hypothetical protein